MLNALLPAICLLHVLLVSAGASVKVQDQVQQPPCDLSRNGNYCGDLALWVGTGFGECVLGFICGGGVAVGKGGFGHEGPGVRALEVLSIALVFVHMHTVKGHRDVPGCTVCVVEGTAAQQSCAFVAAAYCRAQHSSRASDGWCCNDSLIAPQMEPSVPSVGSR